MIKREELSKYCKIIGFNLGQAERDYLQHVFLLFLSRNSKEELIFKGGTALQKAYGLNRFSIDLDFTLAKESDLQKLSNELVSNMSSFGYETSLEEKKTIGKTFIFKIKGPLYNNTQNTIYNLKFEISMRENIIKPPLVKEIIPVYTDLQPYIILLMDEEEILAEKVRAIMGRNQPRDIFDLNFLLRKGIKPNVDIINMKLSYYKEKFNKKLFAKKVLEKKVSWQNDLRNLIKDLPDFDKISDYIISSFDNQLG